MKKTASSQKRREDDDSREEEEEEEEPRVSGGRARGDRRRVVAAEEEEEEEVSDSGSANSTTAAPVVNKKKKKASPLSITPNPLLPHPVNLAAPTTLSSAPAEVVELRRSVALLNAKLTASDAKFNEILEYLRSDGTRKKATPPSASSSSSWKRASLDGTDEEGEEQEERSQGRPRKKFKPGRKSRAHRTPKELCEQLTAGGEGVANRNWNKVVAFAMALEDTLRLVYAHMMKFPTQSEVEDWWLHRVVNVAGLQHLAAPDPAYSDIREWVKAIAGHILTWVYIRLIIAHACANNNRCSTTRRLSEFRCSASSKMRKFVNLKYNCGHPGSPAFPPVDYYKDFSVMKGIFKTGFGLIKGNQALSCPNTNGMVFTYYFFCKQ